jgi:hypothetical protein
MKTITSKIVTVCAVILLANLSSPQAQSNPGKPVQSTEMDSG